MNNARHSGIFTVPANDQITVIGAGGLGATTALTLAKMGYRYMALYDSDIVSEENTGTQLHRPSDIGQIKVDVLADTLHEFSDDIECASYFQRVDANTELTGRVIVSAVDSINARKDIWKAVLASNCEVYIEMRMGAEELNLHTVYMKDKASVKWYDDFIGSQSDGTIPDAPCTSRATFYCGMIGAGMAGAVVRKIYTDIKVPHKIVFNILTGTYMNI